jgi:branched-chain amino acid transport system permease protein
LVVGLVLSYVSGYLGSDTTPLAVLVLLVAVLLVRPGGLFSATATRHV